MERPEHCMDLFDLISFYGYLDEDIARSIFLQILNTTCLLYNTYGIFHRDIKIFLLQFFIIALMCKYNVNLRNADQQVMSLVTTVCQLHRQRLMQLADQIIKDENIIINMNTGEATLVDFGAAALISEDCIREFQGTRSYCPPEWFKKLEYMPLEATVWSLGIVLYIMVSGYLPFQNEIQICLGRLVIPKHVSKDCENLLRLCLSVTPARRPNLLEICKHRWINQPVAVYSETFKEVLQRSLQEKVTSQSQFKLEQKKEAQIRNDGQNDAVGGKSKLNGCNAKTERSSSGDNSAVDSVAMSMPSRHLRSVLNTEMPWSHRRQSSYDNVVLSSRLDTLRLRNFNNIDSNLLVINPIFIKEEPIESEQISSSPNYSTCESYSTEPQNSESYATALEDQRGFACEEIKGIVRAKTFHENSTAKVLALHNGTADSYENEKVVQANGHNRSENYYPCQTVMKSRLVAKRWPYSISITSACRPLKLQKPSGYSRKSITVGSTYLGIFDVEPATSPSHIPFS